MSQQHPRLLLVEGRSELTPEQRDALDRAFSVVDPSAAGRVGAGEDWTLVPAGALTESSRDGVLSLHALASIDASGSIRWTSPAFRALPDAVQEQLTGRAREQVDVWRQTPDQASSVAIKFNVEGQVFDAVLVPSAETAEMGAYGLVRHNI